MKATGLLLSLLLSLPIWADNVTTKRIVDAGGEKAGVFEETVSPDGNYAIGWTIRPRNKEAKPVDWSIWNPEDPFKLIAAYFPDEITDEGNYELINCALDFKDKKLLELPTDDPDFPHKNRGYIVAAWAPAEQGTRYALVQSNARFSTENLWLIGINSSGMHQRDIANDLQKAVAAIVWKKRPLARNAYETNFSLTSGGVTSIPPIVFHESTVTIPFESDIPKSSDDYTEVDGTITIKLTDGSIVKVVSDTPADDPFKDVPVLAKADHDLNQIYSQLSQKLLAAQRADLKHDQLLWIDQRDIDATAALDGARVNSSIPDPRDARNKSLLESTQKRVIELQSRIDALH